jgi:hypothetical protein
VDPITDAPGAIPACLVDPVPNPVTDPISAQVRLWRRVCSNYTSIPATCRASCYGRLFQGVVFGESYEKPNNKAGESADCHESEEADRFVASTKHGTSHI